MDVITIETPSLGDRSYIAIHDDTAIVVDPQRDIDRVLDELAGRGVTLSHVFETHVHNDYVTGGHALAEATGATYVLNRADEVQFDRLGVSDGDVIQAGPMRVTALATPGHTFTHLSWLVEVPGEAPVLFSGGSLLYGSTGRPDLLGPDSTGALVNHQWESARRVAEELPGETRLLPTHGFGSFCAATQSEGGSRGTLADERVDNLALVADRATFVSQTLEGLGAWPAYYVHMAPANRSGPEAPDLSPPEPADADEIRRRIDAGEWVVDLRHRTAWAPGHVAGTVNMGMDGSFITYLGWLAPRDVAVTLLGTAEDVAEAQRDMARIGLARPVAAAVGDDPAAWATGRLATMRIVDFDDLQARREADDMPAVLDVRRDDERRDAAIPGSAHVPVHELVDRMDEVPDDVPVWVHCEAGFRASICASLLARSGREVVLVDDEFSRARELGLAVPVGAVVAPA